MSDKISVLLASAGHSTSTIDVFSGYMKSFSESDGVARFHPFGLHNRIMYHNIASKAIQQATGIDYHGMMGDMVMSRAVRDLFVEYLLTRPDAYVVIDGEFYGPNVMREMHALRKELGRKTVFSCYLTESPYAEDTLSTISDFYDVLFVSEKSDLDIKNPDGSKFISYVPHAYNPDVHKITEPNPDYESDVFFCGTIFPERAEMWSGCGLEDYNTRMFVAASDTFLSKCTPSVREWVEMMKESGKIVFQTLPNKEVAKFYSNAKISLNLHRSRGWTRDGESYEISKDRMWSMNPRSVEIVACGGFMITDGRPEIKSVYGDTVCVADTAEEVRAAIKNYIDKPELRESMRSAAYKKIENRTFDNNASFMVNELREALKVKKE